jgi:hypothetical protein
MSDLVALIRCGNNSRSFHVGPASLWGPPSAFHCYVDFPPPPRLHLHRSLSRFDPRAHVASSGLYIQPCTPLTAAILS